MSLLLDRFRSSRSGSIEIEHALVAPALIIVILAMLETGFAMVSQQSIENGVRLSATHIRESLRKGAMPYTDDTLIKAEICKQANAYLTTTQCVARIQVDLRPLPDLNAIDLAAPITDGSVDTSGWVYQPDKIKAGDEVLLRAALEVPFTLSWLNIQFGLGNLGNGNRLIMATEIFPTFEPSE